MCYLREKIANCPDDIDERFLTKSGHAKIKEKDDEKVDEKEDEKVDEKVEVI